MPRPAFNKAWTGPGQRAISLALICKLGRRLVSSKLSLSNSITTFRFATHCCPVCLVTVLPQPPNKHR